MTSIEKMARLWIAEGGDAEGLAWCWKDIQKEVERLEDDAAELEQDEAP